MKEQHQRHDEAAAAGAVCVVSTSSGLLRLHTSAREHPGAVEADGGVCWTQDIPASGKRDTGVCLCVVWLYTPRYTTAMYHHCAQKVQIRTKLLTIQKYILAMKMFQSLVSRVFLITTINIFFLTVLHQHGAIPRCKCQQSSKCVLECSGIQILNDHRKF